MNEDSSFQPLGQNPFELVNRTESLADTELEGKSRSHSDNIRSTNKSANQATSPTKAKKLGDMKQQSSQISQNSRSFATQRKKSFDIMPENQKKQDPQKSFVQRADNLVFDHKLQEKAHIKHTEEAKKDYAFHQHFLKPVKNVSVLLYFFIVPFFETPHWCLEYYISIGVQKYTLYDCQKAYFGTIPYSNIPCLAPCITAPIQIISFGVICFYSWYKTRWLETTKKRRMRVCVLWLILIWITVAQIVSVVLNQPSYYANFWRPWAALLYFQSLRANAKLVAKMMYKALTLIICIFGLILYCTYIGSFLFKTLYQGYSTFPNFQDTYYQMLILITTCNFPNVMLEGYYQWPSSSLYFVIFLIVGLFFLMNLLLAMVYAGYQSLKEDKFDSYEQKRKEYIAEQFIEFDTDQKGYLNYQDAKKFFKHFFELDYAKSEDKEKFLKILSIVDPLHEHKIDLDHLEEFFSLPNFLDADEALHEFAMKDNNDGASQRAQSVFSPGASMKIAGLQNPQTTDKAYLNQSGTPQNQVSTNMELETPLWGATKLGGGFKKMNSSRNQDQPDTNNIAQSIETLKVDEAFADNQQLLISEDARASVAFTEDANTSLDEDFDNDGKEKCTIRLQNYLLSRKHQIIMLSLELFSLLLLTITSEIVNLFADTRPIQIWLAVSSIINFLFLVEMISAMIGFGPRTIIKENKQFVLELILQIACIFIYILWTNKNYEDTLRALRICSIIFLFRPIRSMYLLGELQQFDVLLSTFLSFGQPFYEMALLLWLVFFFFAQLGIILFSGKIKTTSIQVNNSATPSLYYLMNFNDFGSSMVTLFHIMIINNWQVTCDMYCFVMEANWPRCFFASFWLIVVCFILTIVASFVLDIYGLVDEEIQKEHKKRKYVSKLVQAFSGDGRDSFIENEDNDEQRKRLPSADNVAEILSNVSMVHASRTIFSKAAKYEQHRIRRSDIDKLMQQQSKSMRELAMQFMSPADIQNIKETAAEILDLF